MAIYWRLTFKTKSLDEIRFPTTTDTNGMDGGIKTLKDYYTHPSWKIIKHVGNIMVLESNDLEKRNCYLTVVEIGPPVK